MVRVWDWVVVVVGVVVGIVVVIVVDELVIFRTGSMSIPQPSVAVAGVLILRLEVGPRSKVSTGPKAESSSLAR